MRVLSVARGTVDSLRGVPQWGQTIGEGTRRRGLVREERREVAMKLIKRIAVAVGSLAALALAGGAHMRF
jgi:hypothetical protein